MISWKTGSTVMVGGTASTLITAGVATVLLAVPLFFWAAEVLVLLGSFFKGINLKVTVSVGRTGRAVETEGSIFVRLRSSVLTFVVRSKTCGISFFPTGLNLTISTSASSVSFPLSKGLNLKISTTASEH